MKKFGKHCRKRKVYGDRHFLILFVRMFPNTEYYQKNGSICNSCCDDYITKQRIVSAVCCRSLGGVIPATELKEVMYQAVPYAGFGKVSPFFDETRAVLAEKSLEHMVQERVTTNRENRLEKACRCRRNFLAM